MSKIIDELVGEIQESAAQGDNKLSNMLLRKCQIIANYRKIDRDIIKYRQRIHGSDEVDT